MCDGHTFDYGKGAFARIAITCAVATDGTLTVEIGKQEGNWQPWWHAYRVEVVSWVPKQHRAAVAGRMAAMTQVDGRWSVTVPANPAGVHITLE